MPFSGDAGLFRLRPERFAPSLMYATITPAALRVKLVRADLDEAGLQRDWGKVAEDIAATLDHLRVDVAPFNRDLPMRAKTLIAQHRANAGGGANQLAV